MRSSSSQLQADVVPAVHVDHARVARQRVGGLRRVRHHVARLRPLARAARMKCSRNCATSCAENRPLSYCVAVFVEKRLVLGEVHHNHHTDLTLAASGLSLPCQGRDRCEARNERSSRGLDRRHLQGGEGALVGRLALADQFLVLVPEVLHRALDGPRGGVAERAERAALDVVADV